MWIAWYEKLLSSHVFTHRHAFIRFEKSYNRFSYTEANFDQTQDKSSFLISDPIHKRWPPPQVIIFFSLIIYKICYISYSCLFSKGSQNLLVHRPIFMLKIKGREWFFEQTNFKDLLIRSTVPLKKILLVQFNPFLNIKMIALQM